MELKTSAVVCVVKTQSVRRKDADTLIHSCLKLLLIFSDQNEKLVY